MGLHLTITMSQGYTSKDNDQTREVNHSKKVVLELSISGRNITADNFLNKFGVGKRTRTKTN